MIYHPIQLYRLFLPPEHKATFTSPKSFDLVQEPVAPLQARAEPTKLAVKTLRCIERVHQHPILARVGNQTSTLEFNNEYRIARSVRGKWWLVCSGLEQTLANANWRSQGNVGRDNCGWAANATKTIGHHAQNEI